MLASGVVLGSAIDEAVIVRLVTVATTVALSVVLFAGCSGGGDDHAKVEANLQHYLVSLAPGDSPFPIGAGTPRVKDNRCFELDRGSGWPNPLDVPPPPRLALWNCVVEFGTLAMPVTIAVDDSAGVVAAAQGGMLRGPKPKRYRRNLCKPVPTTRTGSSTC
jgi:hypothetical protein